MTTPPAARRRGRPRKTPGSGIEPRQEILRCAARLFSTNGVGATRITDIAAHVGVASPTIYHHFDNLDDIVETLLRYVVDESAVFAVTEANVIGSASERLRALLFQHVDRLTSGPYDLWFVVGLAQPDSRRFPTVLQHAKKWRQAVEKLIERGINEGEFRPVEPRLALAMVTGCIYGALQLVHELGVVDADNVVDYVMHAMVDARAM